MAALLRINDSRTEAPELSWTAERSWPSSSLLRRSASRAATAAVSWIGDWVRGASRVVLCDGSSSTGEGDPGLSSRPRFSGLEREGESGASGLGACEVGAAWACCDGWSECSAATAPCSEAMGNSATVLRRAEDTGYVLFFVLQLHEAGVSQNCIAEFRAMGDGGRDSWGAMEVSVAERGESSSAGGLAFPGNSSVRRGWKL